MAQKMAQCNHAERGADGEYPCTQTGNKGVSLRTAEIAEKEHVAVGESLRDGSFIFSSRNCKPPPPQRFAFEILSFAYTSHCSDFKSKQGSEGEYRGGLSPSFYPCAPCVSHTVWLLALRRVCLLTDKRKRAPAQRLVLS